MRERALFSAAVLLAMVASACGSSSPTQVGYLSAPSGNAHAVVGTAFIQWTRTGNRLQGTFSEAALSPPDLTHLTSSSEAVSGVINGTSITLRGGPIHATGTLAGSVLTLNITQTNGTIRTFTFGPGAVSDYNAAVRRVRHIAHVRWVAADAKRIEALAKSRLIGPVLVTASELVVLERAIGHPIYWAGPRTGDRYEFTRSVNGYVYVRYLPKGVMAGAMGAHYAIVATYPFPDAYAALKKEAGGSGQNGPGGSLVLVRPQDHKSVLMAFPGIDDQIEIYSPQSADALGTAESGQVQPVTR
jgi:hypothetical protein